MVLKILLIVAILILVLILLLFFLPLRTLSTETPSVTYQSIEEAVEAFKLFDRKEQDQLNPVCQSRLYFTGKKEAKAIVLFHGYTNCPAQFEELGQRLHEKGYNVLIPRIPGHGYADRMTTALNRYHLEDAKAYIHQSIVIADMLGEEVTVMGLSVGGTYTLWASLFEPLADRFITIAPVAYPRGFAPILRNFVVRYAAHKTQEFKWWHPEEKNERPGPPYVYNRYSSSSMGLVLHMSDTVEQLIRRGYSSNKPITFVINEADPALREQELLRLQERFLKAGMHADTYLFPASKQLPHDIIDPHNIKEHKEDVYRILLDIIEKQP